MGWPELYVMEIAAPTWNEKDEDLQSQLWRFQTSTVLYETLHAEIILL